MIDLTRWQGTRWKHFDLLSGGYVCEAYVRTPNWWLQWPENHFNSGLCICFCPLLILPIVIIIFVFLLVQVFLETYLFAMWCMTPGGWGNDIGLYLHVHLMQSCFKSICTCTFTSCYVVSTSLHPIVSQFCLQCISFFGLFPMFSIVRIVSHVEPQFRMFSQIIRQAVMFVTC